MADDIDLDFDDLPSPLPPSSTTSAASSHPPPHHHHPPANPPSPRMRPRNHHRSSPSLLQPSPRIQSPTRGPAKEGESPPWTAGGGAFSFGGGGGARSSSPALGSVPMARSASPLSSIPFPRSPSAHPLGFGWASSSGSSSNGSNPSSPRLSPSLGGGAEGKARGGAQGQGHRRKGSVSISPPFPRSPSPGGADITSVQALGGSPGRSSPFLAPNHHPPHPPDPWHHTHPASIPLPPLHPPASEHATDIVTPATPSVCVHVENAAGTLGGVARRGRARAGSRSGVEDLGLQRRGSWEGVRTVGGEGKGGVGGKDGEEGGAEGQEARGRWSYLHPPHSSPTASTSASTSTSPSLAAATSIHQPPPSHAFFHPSVLRAASPVPIPSTPPSSTSPTSSPQHAAIAFLDRFSHGAASSTLAAHGPLFRAASPAVGASANGNAETQVGILRPAPQLASASSSPTGMGGAGGVGGMKRVPPPPLDLSQIQRTRSPVPSLVAAGSPRESRERRRSIEGSSTPPRSPANGVGLGGRGEGGAKVDLSLPPRSGYEFSDDVDDSPPALDLGPEAVLGGVGGVGEVGEGGEEVGGAGEGAEVLGTSSPESRYRRFAMLARAGARRAVGGSGGVGEGETEMNGGDGGESLGGAALMRFQRRRGEGAHEDEDGDREGVEEGEWDARGWAGLYRSPNKRFVKRAVDGADQEMQDVGAGEGGGDEDRGAESDGSGDSNDSDDEGASWIAGPRNGFWRHGAAEGVGVGGGAGMAGEAGLDGFVVQQEDGFGMPNGFGGVEQGGGMDHPLGDFGEGDDDGLSYLERIFVFAKSENPYHRIVVAQRLPEWLEHVDLCEAVEYVLPLLNGLGTNDEAVREAFAAALCNIMWHFFTNCPLLEAEGADASDDDATTPQASMQVLRPDPSSGDDDSPQPGPSSSPPAGATLSAQDVPMLGFRERADSGTDSTVSSTQSSSASASAAASSEQESAPSAETSCHPSPHGCGSPVLGSVDRPHISASVFTALLGALLADMHETVAACARYGFLTLLCRLTGAGEPDERDMPTDMLHAGAMDAFLPLEKERGVEAGEVPTHKHRPYTLSEEGKRLIVNEMIEGIVLALARLDAAQVEDGDGVEIGQRQEGFEEEGRPPRERTISAESNASSNASEEDRDEWADVPLGRPAVPDFSTNFLSEGEEPIMRSTFSDTLSDLVPFQGGQDRAAEEAAMGRQISMLLIASIAQTGCFEASTLADRLLPEVAKMPKESMNHVRQQASLTLGIISMALPEPVVADRSLPLLKEFAEDASYDVRRQTCLSLPGIVGRLLPEDRRAVASELIAKFSEDSEHDVREAATQILGELIHAFHEDAAGPPQSIVQLFLDGSPRGGANAGARALTASSSASDLGHTDVAWPPTSFMARFQAHADAERPFACAYNFPAVALTLGAGRWPELKEMYHTLASTTRYPPKVRRSLACSVHEVAKIVGKEQASADLAGPLAGWLGDVPEVVEAVLEHLPETLEAMTPEAALGLLDGVGKLWEGDTASIVHWRVREKATLHLSAFAESFGPVDGGAERLMGLLARALRDSVAAIRESGIQAVPTLYRKALSSAVGPLGAIYDLIEDLSSDADYRKRMVSLAAVLAIIRTAEFDRTAFESRLLPTVSRLASDRVAGVRIGVSRLVAELCLSSGRFAEPATRPVPLSHLIADLVDDRESVVRAFVAPLAPPAPPSLVAGSLTNGSYSGAGSSAPSSPIAVSSAADGPDELIKDDDEMMSSGIEIFSSQFENESMLSVRPSTPDDSMSGIEESFATPRQRRSPSPVETSQMDIDPSSLVNLPPPSSSPTLEAGSAIAPSLESAMDAPVFSRPPAFGQPQPDSVWMREMADGDGFVEIGREGGEQGAFA